ncbi:DUF952 domain-containing protein [Rhodospira trueperi]|uniref:Uncharacterized conserved protein, DUF952 family n=1 Tax=Rhodospira trueperi TaxID=69960 RepID=A0A1G7CRB4_9PROT|nr:DUF952 domain-containing protein [Rhodospira trueperi]SDE41206.1 Uncharacterized conserved protein, DUF952 family [Rhodospira trueperi]
MIDTDSQAPPRRLLYRVCQIQDWRAAVSAGVFTGSDTDRADGFIHLSAADQVERTLTTHYSGVPSLILLTLDGARLDGEVRWEAARGGAPFPHLYGTIPMLAVLAALPLPDDRENRMMLPPLSDRLGDLAP